MASALAVYEPSVMAYEKMMEKYAVASKPTMRMVLPINNGTFATTGANIIRFNLTAPSGLVSFSESYLSFRVTNASGADMSPDFSAFSFFNRVRVIAPGGAIIQDLQHINLYINQMMIAKADPEWLKSKGSFMGCSDDAVMYSGTKKAQIASAGTRDYVLPLSMFKGIFDTEAFLPLFFTPTGLTIEFTIEDDPVACIGSGMASSGGDYNLSLVQMHIQEVSLDSEVKGAIASKLASAGGIMIQGEDYQHIPSSNAGAETEVIIRLDGHATSVKSVFAFVRPNGDDGGDPATYHGVFDKASPTLSCTSNRYFTGLYLTNGGVQYPTAKIDTVPKLYAETLKALGDSLTSARVTGKVTYTNYSDTTDHVYPTATYAGYDRGVSGWALASTAGTLTSTAGTITDLTLTEGTPNTLSSGTIEVTSGALTITSGTVTPTYEGTYAPLTTGGVIGLDTESFVKDADKIRSGMMQDNMSLTFNWSGTRLPRRYDVYCLRDCSYIFQPDGTIVQKI